MRHLHSFCFLLLSAAAVAQCDRWQQRITCALAVDLDVAAHTFTGTEKLVYRNNSPDTLSQLFFHLYFNAFKPGSEMDVRSRTIADPDPRVGDRIARLSPQEQGDLRCGTILQDGKATTQEFLNTILRVRLAKPLLPGRSTTLTFDFHGQVPLQIRRSGRDNKEGVAYSMTQWFPKVAVYDHQGWHADPYVGREFYGEWGDYDVRITLDSSFTVAASGELVNPQEVGHGYAPLTKPVKRTDGRSTWHFQAPNVHDFAWAADPQYKHVTAQVPNGPLLRFIYKRSPELESVWKDLPGYMVRSFQFMAKHFGAYPYPSFSFVQGGDGGMEYPNMTLITGDRKLGSLVGTSVHESIHNWFYGMLASDEGSYPWMDEGFTEFAGNEVMRYLFPGQDQGRPHEEATEAYLRLAGTPDHEPMSTHADHFVTNRGYGATAYSKGEFFLDQLGEVIGDSTLHRGLLLYYDRCRFKHPEPIDVQRCMERTSGMQLDWYFDEWINSTRTLDYAVQEVVGRNDSLEVTLVRKGEMVMPIDVAVTGVDGVSTLFHVPTSLALGARTEPLAIGPYQQLPAWQWTDPTYTIVLPARISSIQAISIDPFGRLADSDRSNDQLLLEPGTQGVMRR